MPATLQELVGRVPQVGTLEWIGLRPARRAAMQVVTAVEVSPATGLAGDRYAQADGKRQVTLLQAEYLPVIAALVGATEVQPEQLRRNLVVRGINLWSLQERRIRIGATVVLEITGRCFPCSRMEQTLGPGGYQAARGHGGLTARVVTGGILRTGDAVSALDGALPVANDPGQH